MFIVKKLSWGDLGPALFFVVVGIGLVILPFQILANRKAPIESVGEIIVAVTSFVLFISFGVYCIWAVVCLFVSILFELLWWGHLKEGMRKEDVLHILGEPTSKYSTPFSTERWNYSYKWFALEGQIDFLAEGTVTFIQPPEQKHKIWLG